MIWPCLCVTLCLICTGFHGSRCDTLQADNSTEAEFEAIYKILASQQALIQAQAQSILELKQDNSEQSEAISQLKRHIKEDLGRGYEKNIYHEFGCEHENITLSCQQPQWINITGATYGMNSAQCGDTCCTPSPSDCSELVSENDIATWLSLKLACDNQTSCTYQYSGAVINDCELSYVADYMQIFYDCLPVSATAPIGFTARLSVSTLFQVDEVVIFDDAFANYGNHYQPSTGYFTCPRHGIYLIGLNVYSNSDTANLEIMFQDEKVMEVYVPRATYNHAGAQIVQECNIGDIIWVRADQQSYVFSDFNMRSHFYATFLQSMF